MKYHNETAKLRQIYQIKEEEEPIYIKEENENWEQIEEEEEFWDDQFEQGNYKNILLSR